MTIFDKGIMIWVAWCKPYDTNNIKPISNSQQLTKMLEALALATRTNSFKSSCVIIRCVLQCVIITVRLCGFEGVLHAQVGYSCHCVPMFHILIVLSRTIFGWFFCTAELLILRLSCYWTVQYISWFLHASQTTS